MIHTLNTQKLFNSMLIILVNFTFNQFQRSKQIVFMYLFTKKLFNNYTHKAVFRLQIRKQSMFVVTEIIVLQLRIKYLMSLACFWTHPLNVHRIRLRRTGCKRRSYWSSDQIQFRGHRRRAIKLFLELSYQWKVVLPWPGQQWQGPREWGQTWWRPFRAVSWSSLSSRRLESWNASWFGRRNRPAYILFRNKGVL